MPQGVYSNARRRTWTTEEAWRVEEMIGAGASSVEIARALRRSQNSVEVWMKRNVKRREMRPLTARAVALRLGIGCAKTVTRWVVAGWLVGTRGQRIGPNRSWVVDEDALLSFLASPEHWHRWTAERISDRDLREWAQEIRRERYLTPREVGARFFVGHSAVNNWIHADLLPAVRYGNWWIAESSLVGFVPPSERSKVGRIARRFDAAEDAQLMAMRAAGHGRSVIGRALGRYPAVIMARAARLDARAVEAAA